MSLSTLSNERLHCSDDVETTYYSALMDSNVEADLVCYSCGNKVPVDCFVKYVQEKAVHSQVFPTCTIQHCAKDPRKKFMAKRARKVDKEWKDAKRMEKRKRAMQILQQTSENVNQNENVMNVEDEETDSVSE